MTLPSLHFVCFSSCPGFRLAVFLGAWAVLLAQGTGQPPPETPPNPPPAALQPVQSAAEPAPPADTQAAAMREVPPLPRNHVLDYGQLFSIDERQELSRRLLSFRSESRLVLYLYVLPAMPELPMRDILLALRESWLTAAPLSGAVVVVPGAQYQLFCVIGGKEADQRFSVKVLVEKANNAAQAATVSAPIRDQVLLASQKLLEELAALNSATVPPDALLVSKAAPVTLTRWWSRLWEDVMAAFTSPWFYAGLGAVALAALLWGLARWLNRRRRHYFPKVKPRLRFNGLYSGGNNARMMFVGKRNTERAQQAEEEKEDKLSLPDDDV